MNLPFITSFCFSAILSLPSVKPGQTTFSILNGHRQCRRSQLASPGVGQETLQPGKDCRPWPQRNCVEWRAGGRCAVPVVKPHPGQYRVSWPCWPVCDGGLAQFTQDHFFRNQFGNVVKPGQTTVSVTRHIKDQNRGLP